jgi:predicted  nucleic acid-binding Zn-ribbon protein
MTILDALKLRCLRCGHEWLRRSEKYPRQCPACTSPYFDREREAPGGKRNAQRARNAPAAVRDEGALPSLPDDRDLDRGMPEAPRIEGVTPGRWPQAVASLEEAEAQIAAGERCGYREQDRDRGDWLFCAKPPHPPKQGHSMGLRISYT